MARMGNGELMVRSDPKLLLFVTLVSRRKAVRLYNFAANRKNLRFAHSGQISFKVRLVYQVLKFKCARIIHL